MALNARMGKATLIGRQIHCGGLRSEMVDKLTRIDYGDLCTAEVADILCGKSFTPSKDS